MEKSNLFFADVMRRHTLTDEQETTLQEWFFPGCFNDDPNKQQMESIKDMVSAYNKWQAEQSAQVKKAELEKPLPPMTDAEIDEIAKMF